MEQFAIEMLKYKVLDCLSTMDRKILNAKIDSNESLDELVVKADPLLETETRLIAAVSDNQTGNRTRDIWYTEATKPIGRYGDTTEEIWGTEETRPMEIYGDTTEDTWNAEEVGQIGMYGDTWGQNVR